MVYFLPFLLKKIVLALRQDVDAASTSSAAALTKSSHYPYLAPRDADTVLPSHRYTLGRMARVASGGATV